MDIYDMLNAQNNMEVHQQPYDFNNPSDNQQLVDYSNYQDNTWSDSQNYANSDSMIYHSHQHQTFENSHPDFNNTHQSIESGLPSEHLDNNQYYVMPREAHTTPSSPGDIYENKEVTFKDSSGNEQHGTVMDVHSSGDTYKIQTSEKTYENVAYHDIEKYGSK